MSDKSLQTLLKRLLSHPWVLRFFAKATRMSASELTSQLEDALAAARDADKLGMRDEILANANAIEARRKSRREARAGIAGASSIPQILADDVEFIYNTMYMFDRRFSTINKFLETCSPEQVSELNRAIWKEVGIEI